MSRFGGRRYQRAPGESAGASLIFGHDANDGDPNDASADKFWGSRFTKAAGAVTAIKGRFASTAAGGEQFTVLCYSDSTGVPDSLLWQTGFTTLVTSPSELGFSLPGDVSDSDAAGAYWLFIAERSTYTGQYFYASESGGIMVALAGTNPLAPPATWPGSTSTFSDLEVCVWCEYDG